MNIKTFLKAFPAVCLAAVLPGLLYAQVSSTTPNTDTSTSTASSTFDLSGSSSPADMSDTATATATTTPSPSPVPNSKNNTSGADSITVLGEGDTVTNGVDLEIQNLQNEINSLDSTVATMQSQIAALMSEQSAAGSSTATSTATSSGVGSSASAIAATVSPSSWNIPAGGHVDFNGREFGMNESVVVIQDGNQVATARADSGGNFSTGSLTMPLNPGNYTYSFIGTNSGKTALVTITVM
ncbi:MAG: hypothetical protein KGI59_01825 [Patescibacteria group bacterium]|nr:hypothetical protein [Patescibacteria group bacterium]MDE2172579.1 hypothetical protein [Patescibacteria group bacterium]